MNKSVACILAVCQNMIYRLEDINKLVPHRVNFGEYEVLLRAAISTALCCWLFVNVAPRADSGVKCSCLGNIPKNYKLAGRLS